MTPELIEAFVADYRSGLGVYSIADEHGVHRHSMTNHLVAAGIVLRRTITEAERSRARELFERGMFIKDIARELGRNPATIAKLVRPSNDPSHDS